MLLSKMPLLMSILIYLDEIQTLNYTKISLPSYNNFSYKDILEITEYYEYLNGFD